MMQYSAEVYVANGVEKFTISKVLLIFQRQIHFVQIALHIIREMQLQTNRPLERHATETAHSADNNAQP